MLCQFKKLSIKQGLKMIFCRFEKIYRKNKNCRVAMTTTYTINTNTSCNSENMVACLVSGEGCCMHVFLVNLNNTNSKSVDDNKNKLTNKLIIINNMYNVSKSMLKRINISVVTT